MGDPIVDLAQSYTPFTPVPKVTLRDGPDFLTWLVASTSAGAAGVCVLVCVHTWTFLCLPPYFLPSISSLPPFLPPSLPPSLPPFLPLLPTEPDVPGMPTEDELIARYKQHSGLDFSERELRYAKTVVCLRFISAFQVRWC